MHCVRYLRGGTVVVMIYRRYEITIAADSKFSGALGEILHKNTSCKISRFGTHIVFSAAHHTVVPVDDRFVWAEDDAREAFKGVFRYGFTGQHATDAVANRWARVQVARWQKALSGHDAAYAPDDAQGGRLLVGLFAGIEAERPRVVRVVITYDEPMYGVDGFVPAVAHMAVIEPPGKGEYKIYAIGQTEIVEKMQQREIESAGRQDPERWPIIAAERLVQDTIDFHPRHNLFSGPIDIVRWTPQTHIQWIRRKPECPAN